MKKEKVTKLTFGGKGHTPSQIEIYHDGATGAAAYYDEGTGRVTKIAVYHNVGNGDEWGGDGWMLVGSVPIGNAFAVAHVVNNL